MSLATLPHTTVTVKPLATLPVAVDDRTPRQRFWDGFEAYCAGLSVADLHDAAEIKGWWSACSSQAECETATY